MNNALSIQGLTKSFQDFTLGPLSIDLAPGTVLGYIGPNGSGKTTTLNCLMGFLQPEAGQMRIFGQPTDPEATDWKQQIGFISDEPVFYEKWTAAKNIKVISRFYPNWSSSLAEKLVNRFKLPLNKKVKQLSKGNRAKLALVLAMSHSPRLLLLDEPTSGLDPIVRTEVLEIFWELLEENEQAIFYVTHILSDISRLADELAFLNDGKIILRAMTNELLSDWGRISFTLKREHLSLPNIHNHYQEGAHHKVVSSKLNTTLEALHELGAERIDPARMTLEEIAVQILKNGCVNTGIAKE